MEERINEDVIRGLRLAKVLIRETAFYDYVEEYGDSHLKAFIKEMKMEAVDACISKIDHKIKCACKNELLVEE